MGGASCWLNESIAPKTGRQSLLNSKRDMVKLYSEDEGNFPEQRSSPRERREELERKFFDVERDDPTDHRLMAIAPRSCLYLR